MLSASDSAGRGPSSEEMTVQMVWRRLSPQEEVFELGATRGESTPRNGRKLSQSSRSGQGGGAGYSDWRLGSRCQGEVEVMEE